MKSNIKLKITLAVLAVIIAIVGPMLISNSKANDSNISLAKSDAFTLSGELTDDNGNAVNAIAIKNATVNTKGEKTNSYTSGYQVIESNTQIYNKVEDDLSTYNEATKQCETVKLNTREDAINFYLKYISSNISSRQKMDTDSELIIKYKVNYNLYDSEKTKIVYCKEINNKFVIYDFSYYKDLDKDVIKLIEGTYIKEYEKLVKTI